MVSCQADLDKKEMFVVLRGWVSIEARAPCFVPCHLLALDTT